MSVAPTSPSSRRRPWFHSVIYRPLTVSTALGFYERHRQGKREIMGLMAVAVRFSQDGFVKFTFCALGGLHRVHRFPGLQTVNPGLISRCGCLS
jgi:hypothetical protein